MPNWVAPYERALVLALSPDRVSNVCELTDPREVLQVARGESFQEQLEAAEDSDYPQDDERRNGKRNGDALEPYRHEIERLRAMVGSWRMKGGNGGTP